MSQSYRTQARRLAVQLLYALEHSSQQDLNVLIDIANPRLPQQSRDFAIEIVTGIREGMAFLDERIDESLANWRMDRLHAVERNILRLGAYEIFMRPEIPARVAIDEAVGLARRFGDDEAWKLINGVLDRMAQGRIAAEDGAQSDGIEDS